MGTTYFQVRGYSEFRKDRGDSRAGGVIIFVHNSISSEIVLNDIWQDNETVTCKIRYGNKSLLVSCIYRPPGPNLRPYNISINNTILKIADIHADQYLICGDFNYGKIDWSNHMVNAGEDSLEQLFYDATQSAFLHQHVEEFTRKRGADQPSRLDLIFSKNEFEVESIRYDPPIGSSDHSVLNFTFTLEGSISVDDPDQYRRKYYLADYPAI